MNVKIIVSIAIMTLCLLVVVGCGSSANEQPPEDTKYQTVEMEGVTFEVPENYVCEIGYYTGIVEAQLNSSDMSSAPVSVTLEGNSGRLTPKNIMDQDKVAKVDRSNAKGWKCKKVNETQIDGALCQVYEYSWEDGASGTAKKVYRAIITNNNVHIDVKSEKYASLDPAAGVVNHIVSTMKLDSSLTLTEEAKKMEEDAKGAPVAGTHPLDDGETESEAEEQNN